MYSNSVSVHLMYDENVGKLESLGYYVSIPSYPGEYLTTISWS